MITPKNAYEATRPKATTYVVTPSPAETVTAQAQTQTQAAPTQATQHIGKYLDVNKQNNLLTQIQNAYESRTPIVKTSGVPSYLANTPENSGVKVNSVTVNPTATNESGYEPGSGGYLYTVGGSGGGSGASVSSIYQNYLDQILGDYQAASEARQNALTDNYNRALATLQQNHNQQVNSLQQNADDSLRQAYINYMLNQKGINQTLANQGINGGATESILANLYNNYGSNRNTIAKELQNGLADLSASYNSNVSDLANSYGSNLADVLADYYNSAASTKDNYASKIASALASASSSKSGSTAKTYYRPYGISDGVWNGIQSALDRYSSGKMTDTQLKALFDQIGLSDTDRINIMAENGYGYSSIANANNSANASLAESDVLSGIAANKSNPTALLKFLDNVSGYTDEQINMLLLRSGIDPESLYNSVYGNNNK